VEEVPLELAERFGNLERGAVPEGDGEDAVGLVTAFDVCREPVPLARGDLLCPGVHVRLEPVPSDGA
jgi:hypothetical protein